jgi:hypothetical protein
MCLPVPLTEQFWYVVKKMPYILEAYSLDLAYVVTILAEIFMDFLGLFQQMLDQFIQNSSIAQFHS